jgi:hypothetical protein
MKAVNRTIRAMNRTLFLKIVLENFVNIDGFDEFWPKLIDRQIFNNKYERLFPVL